MTLPVTYTKSKSDISLIPITAKHYKKWLSAQPAATKAWLKANGFIAQDGTATIVPDEHGKPSSAICIIPPTPTLWDWSAIASQLPAEHHYSFAKEHSPECLDTVLLGWALEEYRFETFRKRDKQCPTLCIPKSHDTSRVSIMAESIILTRTLINRPANDLTPAALAEAAKELASECKASFIEIVGDALLKNNYPTIHAVGRACDVPPRLIDISWGNKKHPKVTLVGKGVCFDTGGLNIKGGSSMGLMKKDMGGAAATLGLACMIMKTGLPIRLRVLIPAVENSISGNAFRPQDIITTRKGLTVEVGNTDAEGRLILCDALAEADDEQPDLLVDMATLTGASRVALGPDIPSFFTNDDTLASNLASISKAVNDPLWQLPLWSDYMKYMEGDVTDLDNSGSGGGYAGAITAALFLQRFVTQTKRWLHIDMMAWNVSSRPGRPKGGEAQGIRALFDYLEKTYTR